MIAGPPPFRELQAGEDHGVELPHQSGCGDVQGDRKIPPRDGADHEQVDVAVGRRASPAANEPKMKAKSMYAVAL